MQTLSPRVNTSGVCDCAAGWVGPECGICTSDEACASVEGEGSRCAQTSFAGEKKLAGFCEITTPAITDLLHGTGFVQMKFEPGDFSFLFIKRHDNPTDPALATYLPIFRCQSDRTTVKTNHGTGAVTYTSPDLSCALTCVVGEDRSCTSILERVVKTVGSLGGSTIICDPFTKACAVKEITLDTFIAGGVKTANCQVSECLAPVPLVSPKTTPLQPPSVPAAPTAPAGPLTRTPPSSTASVDPTVPTALPVPSNSAPGIPLPANSATGTRSGPPRALRS
ncbi:hypothetical protein NSK_008113 [Nannochloropsis salina CCMP1776]|uniref:EGF-like domain-containing protein n=1 Tax=Nannochloropsis salina CCMP1776 TaxID=1027361 RepID=A0A4D9CR83_9STRA|nr:hypothetical protein NSK_008113 [Nannochloropsis salina CCMP1776]|eukprot:TFJ80537.1 hypothetical protein NSK_008113 [Nannochloropsis salina CCMP1776]